MAVNIILYILLITGLFLVFSRSFKNFSYKMKINKAVKKKIAAEKHQTVISDMFSTHIYNLLQITVNAKTPLSVTIFSLVSGFCGLFGFCMSFLLLPPKLVVLVALGCAIMPYVLLRTRLQNIRVKVSHEGEILVTELLNNYKINHYNILEAIRTTANTITDAPHSKKMLYNLSKSLDIAATNEDVASAINVFKYGIGTSWANILGGNMMFAHLDGIIITSSLQDLADTIIKAKKALEMNSRENNEGLMILKILVPLCYFLTYLGAIKFFNFTTEKFLYYQFQTETGITWFVGIVGFYIASLIIAIFLSRGKMDL